jgi:NADPH2:quinone reductase
VRAVRLHAFDGTVRVDDVPQPQPGPDEVLFEPAFVGVNPLDVWLTEGSVAGGRQTLPFVPGSEGSGTVDGRRVAIRGLGVGVLRDGLFRERANVPVGAVVNLPDDVSLEQAAAVGVVGSTAWRLVNDVAKVTAEDRVLVLGASGGVGSLVVQLARAKGARVLGQTGDAGKEAFVREQGAEDVVVVTDAAALTDAVRSFEPTVVTDPLADGYTEAAVAAMAPFGRLALYGASAGAVAESFDLRALYRKAVSIVTYSGTIESPEVVREGYLLALDAVRRGELRVPIDEVLPLDRAADALERIRNRGVRGKLLLQP